MTTKGTDNRFRSLTVVGESGTPSTPGSGDFKLYVADDGTFYLMDDTGTPTAVGGGGGFSDPMTTRGDIIVRNASNVTARLAVGSAGKVLSSDGTDVSWQTPGGGAVVFLQRLTASSSATLDFTGLSSTYETYIFDFQEIVPATDNVNFLMIVGTGGGPTYDTGSNYGYSNVQAVDDGSSGVRASAAATSCELGNAWNNTATSGGGSGSITWFGPANGSRHPRYVMSLTRRAAGAEITSTGGGRYLSATAITAFRFLFSSGNIASGVIDVYGRVHA